MLLLDPKTESLMAGVRLAGMAATAAALRAAMLDADVSPAMKAAASDDRREATLIAREQAEDALRVRIIEVAAAARVAGSMEALVTIEEKRIVASARYALRDRNS